jgi:hypothetical protein
MALKDQLKKAYKKVTSEEAKKFYGKVGAGLKTGLNKFQKVQRKVIEDDRQKGGGLGLF